MTDESTRALIQALARELPQALDDEAASRLAARIRPYFIDAQAPSESVDLRLLTTANAASRANVHVETVRKAIRAGRLRVAGRVGRSPRIQAADVDRWIADASEVGGTMARVSARRGRAPRLNPDHSLKAAFKSALQTNDD